MEVKELEEAREEAVQDARPPQRPSSPHPPTPPVWSRSFGPTPVTGNLRGHLLRGLVRLGTLLAADLLALFLGWYTVRHLRRGTFGETAAGLIAEFLPNQAVSSAQLAVALVLGLTMAGAYRRGDHWRDPTRTLSGVGMAVVLALYSDFWHGEAQVVALRGLVIWTLLGLALVLVRGLFALLRDRMPTPRFTHRVLAIHGAGASARPPELGPDHSVVAVLHADELPDDLEDMGPWLAGGVDTLFLQGRLSPEAFGHVTDFALSHGCRLLCVPQAQGMAGVDTRLFWVRGKPFVEVTAPGLRASQLLLKRVLDVVGSLTLLLLLSPLLALLAALVKLDSPGPVLFRQRRAGYGGRFFHLLKFRSMRSDAEDVLLADRAMWHRYVENDFKLPDGEDPRVTRVGRFLRRTSLDELPQLLNVLRGDMSLVGPRPVVEPELENYAGKVPALLSVKPGMTGLWQITGRSAISFPERAQLDLEYVRSWSLLRDLWILLVTPPTVLLQRGAH